MVFRYAILAIHFSKIQTFRFFFDLSILNFLLAFYVLNDLPKFLLNRNINLMSIISIEIAFLADHLFFSLVSRVFSG